MSIIDEISKEFTNKKVPSFKAGDTVRVFLKIKEGEKERIQYYEGVVIAIHNNGISTTFKVRKESYGVGVERTFPLFSPLLQKIEVKRRGDVRRAKLYYLRKLSGKKARVKEKKDWMIKKSQIEVLEEEVAEEQAELSEAEAAGAAAAVTPGVEAGEEQVEEAAEIQAAEEAVEASPEADEIEKEETPGEDTGEKDVEEFASEAKTGEDVTLEAEPVEEEKAKMKGKKDKKDKKG